MAQAGQPLITVMDTSMLLAKVHLPQTQIAGLHVGDKAAVTVQGADQSADGSLSLISPALDPGSTTVEVWVKVPNKSGALKPGMPVHVAIEARTLKDITTVPTESVITNKSGGTAVMVVGSDGLAHEREVKLGVTDGKDTQVLTGVQPGEIVVTTGAHSLEDKTKVEVGPAESGDSGDSKGGDEKSPDKATAGEGK
jgi:RND family efflux transporter MFP subunit